jgi:hypothetical protein
LAFFRQPRHLRRHEPYEGYPELSDQLDLPLAVAAVTIPSELLPIPFLPIGAFIFNLFGGTDSIPGDKARDGHDFFTKPTSLIAGSDYGMGFWAGAGGLEQDLLASRGNFDDFSVSNNLGVYKNLALGYDTARTGSPFSLPAQWRKGPERSAGSLHFMVVDAASTSNSFPAGDQYVLVGTLPPRSGVAIGYWEIVPRTMFATEQDVLNRAVALNSITTSPISIAMVTSTERLTINPNYPSGHPFTAIDGSPSSAGRNHVLGTSTAERAAFPLIEARQVDATYRYTGTTYAFSSGNGVLTITNPCLGRELVIDSSNYEMPTRREGSAPASGNAACIAARAGL